MMQILEIILLLLVCIPLSPNGAEWLWPKLKKAYQYRHKLIIYIILIALLISVSVLAIKNHMLRQALRECELADIPTTIATSTPEPVATPTPSPIPAPSPTPEPTPTLGPEPSPIPEHHPIPEPLPSPEPDVSPEPTPEPVPLHHIIPRDRPRVRVGQGMPTAQQISQWYNNFVPTELEEAIFEAINQVRVEHGRDVLPWSHMLASAAALRSTYLAESDIWGNNSGSFTSAELHRSLQTRGSWWAATSRGGVRYEGITSLHSFAQSYVDFWMSSELHRDRLLSNYNYAVGVGSAENSHQGTLMIYVFFDASGR